MTVNGKPPEAIQWHEGMLLSPHHFQQEGIRADALRCYFIRKLCPYFWGVVDMRVDEAALADGVFRLIALEAVMPDGTVVGIGEQETHLPEVDLTQQLEGLKSGPGKVWLAIPELKNGVSWTSGELPRYRSIEGEVIRDLNTGDDELHIPRVRPILSLHFEKPSKLYSYFPIAEVVNHDNGLSLTTFCPPCLSVPGQSRINELCRELGGSLRRKVTHISGKLESNRGGDPAVVAELERTLHYLVSGLPGFEAVMGARPAAHPYQLYLALAALSGPLAALSEYKVPETPPVYDHDDPLASIKQMSMSMIHILEKRVSEDWNGIPFQRKDNLFFIHFKRDWVDANLVIALRPGGLSERDAVRWMSGALIASEDDVKELRNRRTLGWKREVVETVSSLVAPDGSLLFNLEQTEGAPARSEKRLLVIPVSRESENIPKELILFVKKG